jgi:hypothetical protein
MTGSGGEGSLPIKTNVVCFSLERTLEPMAIPGICGNGAGRRLVLGGKRPQRDIREDVHAAVKWTFADRCR